MEGETALLNLNRINRLFLAAIAWLSPFKRKVNGQYILDSEEQIRRQIKEQAQQGNYQTAIALLTQLIQCHPQSAIDYNNRGLMYFYQGKPAKALKDYHQALKLNNRLDQAYNNRGNCYASQGNLAAALSDYEKAIDLNPSNLKALINYGITLREMGLYDLALENFDIALMMGENHQGRIYAERGYTYHLRGDWNCAIADYSRALSILPLKLEAYRHKVEGWLTQLHYSSATG